MGVSPQQVQDGEEVGRALDTGDQVELSVVINRKLGTTVAEAVKLVCKAEDKRELGAGGLSPGSPPACTEATCGSCMMAKSNKLLPAMCL